MQRLGYSLLELLIALAIFGICFTFVASFNQQLQRDKLTAITEDILDALRLARFSALMQHETVYLRCEKLNNCTNGVQLTSETGRLLKQWQWFDNKNLVVWHGLQQAGALFASDINHSAANGRFLLYSKGQLVREIVVNRLGLGRVVA